MKIVLVCIAAVYIAVGMIGYFAAALKPPKETFNFSAFMMITMLWPFILAGEWLARKVK